MHNLFKLFGFFGLVKPAMYFAPDAEGNGGGDGEQTPPGSETPPGNKGKDAEAKLTHTQAELSAMLGDRATRASASAIAALLEKAGYKTVEEMNAALEEGKKLKQSQMSEAEKTAAALKAAEERAAKAEADKTEALSKANERLMKAAVLSQATGAGFRAESVNDVWLVIDRSKIEEKDGEFKGLKEAIEAVAKAKPFWLADQKVSRGTPGNGMGKTQGRQNEKTPPPTRPATL
jgi:hypothetical protein